jgi:hypothetical protein
MLHKNILLERRMKRGSDQAQALEEEEAPQDNRPS